MQFGMMHWINIYGRADSNCITCDKVRFDNEEINKPQCTMNKTLSMIQVTFDDTICKLS